MLRLLSVEMVTSCN